ncbi:MAG: PLDc N-terminal domain-containing protein [Actinomycetota bacterium]|nr:PLDc N-terminal domain-containing protein [Actinomycetota bacterium]
MLQIASYPLLNVFWWMLWFFLFVIWIWLLITVFIDVFRSHMSGWAKAGWTIFIVFMPMLGVLVYLIANGGKMQERSVEHAAAVQQAQNTYIRDVAGTETTADQLKTLSDLHDAGKLTDQEFATQKAKLLG